MINGLNTSRVKVAKIEEIGERETYDICVENAQHYILDNGLISHNTGAIYNASIIMMLSKAKLKDGEIGEFDLGQSGIVVSCKTEKNRLAKPKKVQFEISFNSGANPYKGLEFFCEPENFDKIGIAKGKMDVDKSTGEEFFKPGGNFWYVKHLGKSVPGKHLHTATVFTREVLERMAPIVEEYFKYNSLEDMELADAEEILNDTDMPLDPDNMDAENLFN